MSPPNLSILLIVPALILLRRISAAQVSRLMDGPLAPIESVSHYFFAPTPLDREKKILRFSGRSATTSRTSSSI